MRRTVSRYLDFETLLSRGEPAAIVLKLMMACNDLTYANQALADWKQDQQPHRRYRQRGTCMYFIRTEMSHLHEALKVVAEIRDNQELKQVVDQCDEETQRSFRRLELILPGGIERLEFERFVGRIRHNITFHYAQSQQLVMRAMQDRAGRAESRGTSITRGSEAHLWHFQAADEIVDSIVVRQLWQIPQNADLATEANRIADRMQEYVLAFLDFSGEFIWKWAQR